MTARWLAAVPVATIAAHPMLVLLLQLGTVLGLAVLLGRLATRLRLPAVVGELAAGVLLGPSVLAHALPGVSAWLFPPEPGQQHLLDAIGTVGVLLLVGVTGMHVDLGLLRRQGTAAVLVGGGALVVPLAAGFGLGLVLPSPVGGAPRTLFALFLGVAMAVSAIPVIAKILLELRLLHRGIGQLVMSAAALDDIAGWLLLSLVAAGASGGLRAARVAWSVAVLLGVAGLALVAGRPLVRVALRLAARSPDPGVSTATVTVLVLLCAAGTHALGLEPILGAFLCGLLVSASGRVDPGWLAPLRTMVTAVLAPVFFATAGLRMDLTALVHPVVLGAAAAVLLVAVLGKFVGAYAGARAARRSRWEALALGSALNARGVVEVIVATVGLRLGILGPAGYTVIVLVAVVTSMMAGPILRYAAGRIAVTGGDLARERALSAPVP